MKVIDLLNKIANGEIKGISKFIYNGELYEQINKFEKFDNRKGYCCRRKKGITLKTLDTLFDIHKLNDEVEIIEDDKEDNKIKKLNEILRINDLRPPYDENLEMIWKNVIIQQNRINEIIDKLNEMEENK